jgi:hypothetical protein
VAILSRSFAPYGHSVLAFYIELLIAGDVTSMSSLNTVTCISG